MHIFAQYFKTSIHQDMNSLKGIFYGIVTSVTFGLIPLFTLPLMQKGMEFDSILFYRFLLQPWHWAV